MFILGTHRGGLNSGSLAISPDGRFLASSKGVVKVWDLPQRLAAHEVPVTGDPGSVAFSPDGALVVSASGQFPVQVFDPQTGELRRRFPYPSWCRAQCALFSADGTTLVCGGHLHGDSGMIGRVLRWNPETGRLRRAVEDVEGDIGFATLSPDGRYLAAGGNVKTGWLWDLATRKLLATFSCRGAGWRVVAFSPDGLTLAISGGRTIEFWDPRTQQRRHALSKHQGKVEALAFSPHGRLFSAGADGLVRMWDPGSGKELACHDWQVGALNNVVVASDGMTAAAGAVKGRIVVWDLEAV